MLLKPTAIPQSTDLKNTAEALVIVWPAFADEAGFASEGQASTRHVGRQNAPDTSLWSGCNASHVSLGPE